VVLDQRARAAHEGIVGRVIHEEDDVRVAHRDGAGRVQNRRVDRADLQLDAPGVHGLVERDLLPVQTRRAHVDGDTATGRAACGGRSAEGVDRHLILAARLQQHPADAAQGVAAGLDHAAVGVPHPHEGVGGRRGFQRDQLVAALARLPVGDGARLVGRRGERRLQCIDDDEVVAGTVHLDEGAGHERRI